MLFLMVPVASRHFLPLPLHHGLVLHRDFQAPLGRTMTLWSYYALSYPLSTFIFLSTYIDTFWFGCSAIRTPAAPRSASRAPQKGSPSNRILPHNSPIASGYLSSIPLPYSTNYMGTGWQQGCEWKHAWRPPIPLLPISLFLPQ